MSLPCWIRHDWTPWDIPKAFGFELYQNATCKKCGKVKQRNCGFAAERIPNAKSEE